MMKLKMWRTSALVWLLVHSIRSDPDVEKDWVASTLEKKWSDVSSIQLFATSPEIEVNRYMSKPGPLKFCVLDGQY